MHTPFTKTLHAHLEEVLVGMRVLIRPVDALEAVQRVDLAGELGPERHLVDDVAHVGQARQHMPGQHLQQALQAAVIVSSGRYISRPQGSARHVAKQRCAAAEEARTECMLHSSVFETTAHCSLRCDLGCAACCAAHLWQHVNEALLVHSKVQPASHAPHSEFAKHPADVCATATSEPQ